MSAVFPVEVVTPAGGVVLKRDARHLRLPGADGSFGILAGHADLMAALGVGEAELEEGDGTKTLFTVSGGFAQVDAGRVLVLAEASELQGKIDVERARRAHDRAKRLLEERPDGFDEDRARIALARAMLRLKISGRGL